MRFRLRLPSNVSSEEVEEVLALEFDKRSFGMLGKEIGMVLVLVIGFAIDIGVEKFAVFVVVVVG